MILYALILDLYNVTTILNVSGNHLIFRFNAPGFRPLCEFQTGAIVVKNTSDKLCVFQRFNMFQYWLKKTLKKKKNINWYHTKTVLFCNVHLPYEQTSLDSFFFQYLRYFPWFSTWSWVPRSSFPPFRRAEEHSWQGTHQFSQRLHLRVRSRQGLSVLSVFKAIIWTKCTFFIQLIWFYLTAWWTNG